ncbi:hypothetical protein A3860_25175 [Niastella vici]|uniref:Trimeric autotransporter adhesin YadA-like head domain-containing protein n=1 Tax=Niastella vici TaxID=1703345 RepID=A0A1V9FXW0_9BACT|nr:hypothetical protein [Niastella vici]OQP63185.1 hypothetical protein A3860_25175 [Niastella vici]
MKKLFLLLMASCTICTALAQQSFYLKGNNVYFTNDDSPAELVLENSTKTVKGVLVNTGNGSTTFKPVVKINDSTIVFGADTLTFRGGSVSLQQTTDAGNSTTNYINANGGYYQNNTRLLHATDSMLSIGYNAGKSNTSGYGNTAVGHGALQNNTTGYSNTAVGYHGLQQTINGVSNVSIGANSLQANTSGYSNIAIGESALAANTTSGDNVAIGRGALAAITTGSSSVAIGYLAGGNATYGNIVAIGARALQNNTGYGNTAVGYQSLNANTSGIGNTAAGYRAGAVSNGNNNIFIGYNAGSAAGQTGVATNNNTAVGSGALGTVTGSGNTAVGASALAAACGSNNIAIGDSALVLTTGSQNTALGKNAGANITTGNNNLAIGYRAYVPVATNNYQLSIGNLIYGTGLDGTVNTISNGKIGIKTKAPVYEMDVNGKLGVRTIDSVANAVNVLCQDPVTGEIKKTAALSVPQTFVQTATVTVSGTDNETTLISSGTGNLTIPAAAWFAGKSFRIVVQGAYSTDADNAARLKFTIRLGSVVIAQSAGIFAGYGKTNMPYELRAECICRSTGASGTIYSTGIMTYDDAGYITAVNDGTGIATVDLTASQTLNITVTLSDDAAGNAVSAFIVTMEAIN